MNAEMNEENWEPQTDPRLVRICNHVMLIGKANQLCAYLDKHRWENFLLYWCGRLPKEFR